MDFLNPYIRGVLIYLFKVGVKAAELVRQSNNTFGDIIASEGTVWDWLARFRTGKAT